MARSLLVLAVLSLAFSASPASAQTPDIQGGISFIDTPSARASMIRAAAITRAKFARWVSFDGIADPKTSLADALSLLEKRCGVHTDINMAAFRDEGVDDPLSLPIGRPIPPLRGVPASTVLSIILGRTPSRSGVTFYPRGDGMEISTVRAYRYEVRRDGAIVSPTPARLPQR